MKSYLIEIPVYRCPKEKYIEEWCRYKKDKMYDNKCGVFCAQKNEDDERYSFLYGKFGGDWLYNEIVGYIKLYFYGTQIRGEYYCIQQKKIYRTRKKIFSKKTDKLCNEVNIELYGEKDIYGDIMTYIYKCKKKLSSKFVDDSWLVTKGKYVDWNKMYVDYRSVNNGE